MIGKVVKFNNEGVIIVHGEDSYMIPKGAFRDLELGQEVSFDVWDKFKHTAYLTENEPKEGDILVLRVIDKAKVGFFLDTKTKNDLFMPYQESLKSTKKGDRVVVKVLKDAQDRLYATVRISSFLDNKHDYQENDEVEGLVYSVKKDIGVFMVVDGHIDARIDPKDQTRAFEVGDREKVRVKYVLPDGKLAVSQRERSHIQVHKDSVIIMEKISHNPVLQIGDKSSPEEIFELTGLSKQAFKRACGTLKKQGLIEVGPKSIRRVED